MALFIRVPLPGPFVWMKQVGDRSADTWGAGQLIGFCLLLALLVIGWLCWQIGGNVARWVRLGWVRYQTYREARTCDSSTRG
ncbi:MAG TPA: hypothetical protein VJ757_00235 [Pseudonocardiaceae bacterium]|nr:hypothetical protein [Pseudonocardiaceae bacterium]